ncbi:hypothetical protein Droror1_Dr00026495 [Drosera rotundifolia]
MRTPKDRLKLPSRSRRLLPSATITKHQSPPPKRATTQLSNHQNPKPPSPTTMPHPPPLNHPHHTIVTFSSPRPFFSAAFFLPLSCVLGRRAGLGRPSWAEEEGEELGWAARVEGLGPELRKVGGPVELRDMALLREKLIAFGNPKKIRTPKDRLKLPSRPPLILPLATVTKLQSPPPKSPTTSPSNTQNPKQPSPTTKPYAPPSNHHHHTVVAFSSPPLFFSTASVLQNPGEEIGSRKGCLGRGRSGDLRVWMIARVGCLPFCMLGFSLPKIGDEGEELG